MAGINVSSSSAQTAKLWAGQEQLFRDVLKASRLNKFISDTGSSIVHLKRWAEREMRQLSLLDIEARMVTYHQELLLEEMKETSTLQLILLLLTIRTLD